MSQAYSVIGEAKKKATTGYAVDLDLHIKLYLEGSIVEWEYDQDPNSERLFTIGNWLFSLEGVYGLMAQFADGGSGGTVTPINPSDTSLPEPIDWIVDTTATAEAPLKNGDSSVLFNGSNGYPNLRGFNMEFTRGSAVQYITDPGEGMAYYSWDRLTGLFTLINGNAVLGEHMRILPTR